MKKNNIENIRHSLAHILAYAVKELYPDVKLGIGPAIENNFPKIEKRMREIISRDLGFKGKKITPKEAKILFKSQPFKLDLVKEFSKEKKELTEYTTGNFIDLCKGGHIKNTSEINPEAFKLIKTAGAYWRGSEENTMLTRIYAI